VSDGPRTPYPPDVDDEAPPLRDLVDAADVVLEDQDWANRRSSRLALRRVEVRRCRLTGADLGEATLSDTVFQESVLDLVGLRFAKLERVIFRDCRMSEADFYEASLKDVLFERCVLRDATFSSIKVDRVELRGCDLSGVLGVEALRGARMTWNDVLASAPLLAAALGIQIVDD
jgi:uncharacterized protein YjbI with pentapeptide repeats